MLSAAKVCSYRYVIKGTPCNRWDKITRFILLFFYLHTPSSVSDLTKYYITKSLSMVKGAKWLWIKQSKHTEQSSFLIRVALVGYRIWMTSSKKVKAKIKGCYWPLGKRLQQDYIPYQHSGRDQREIWKADVDFKTFWNDHKKFCFFKVWFLWSKNKKSI